MISVVAGKQPNSAEKNHSKWAYPTKVNEYESPVGERLQLINSYHQRVVSWRRFSSLIFSPMNLLEHGSSIEVRTPAKINLFLEVLGRRPDGFHEIETIIAPVSLFDTLRLQATTSSQLTLNCRWRSAGDQPELPPAESNLVFKALSALRKHASCDNGAVVEVVKRIPMEAGMGGASSDAAAALLAANKAWRLNLSHNELAKIGAALGSDIPFFLQAGRLKPAACVGRGEKIKPLSNTPSLPIVIVKPPVGLSTADVYKACTPGDPPIPMQKAARSPHACFNRLQEPAFRLRPELAGVITLLKQAGCTIAQMTGSGTALFGVCHNKRHARQIAGRLRSQNVGAVFTAHTFPAGTTQAA